jgi:hypothetical protein
MARRAVTLQIDEELLAAAEAEAERTGATGSDVVERALRDHFAETNGTILEQVWARNAVSELSEEVALELAYSELKAMRREARGPDQASS